MDGLIRVTARLVIAARKAYTRKWSFLIIFICVFFITVTSLVKLDLLPDDPPAAGLSITATTTADTTTLVAELPVKVSIPKIKLAATIQNPTTTEVDVLDHALLSGAVRYPTSAKLGASGNVILFGHSSYLPVVHNQAYKTFDGIEKLTAGDVVTVYSSDRVYTYEVTSVKKENATDTKSAIPLTVAGRELTLSTCDSFGTKSDRFVVTAEFVESHAIPT